MTTPTKLTAQAKSRLSKVVRELHDSLLESLHKEVESTYRLSVSIEKAGLDQERRTHRERFEAWVDERARALPAKERAAARERFRREAEKEAAYTFLHRLVFLRELEHFGLSRPAVVSGGLRSSGYTQFRDFAPGLCATEIDGYAVLLKLVFEELAGDLPGLFADVGVGRLVPIPPATLRATIEALNDPELDSAWGDDTTLGWVYQYWNDPDREALDAKINRGEKIEPHEIASKTQMFTERYMVEWLLQNSLGATWLAMCQKHGWRADAEGVLPELNARRADWRRRRDAGEVPLDALMPVDEEGLEGRWKYYVLQPIPDAVVEKAPESIRKLKLLDPACGSGHFLVIAFDLLVALYREEARHRGETWSDEDIASSILENNLHGIDIDPRPVQLAAAGLYLKAKVFAPNARLTHLNLVASNLRLGDLPKDDPALVTLRQEIRQATGIPEALTNRIIEGLRGADHLGSLLKVDKAIDDAVREQERAALVSSQPTQGDLLRGTFAPQQRTISFEEARRSVLDRLEEFLDKHAGENDLGLRLDGEQLTAGIRFIRMVKEGEYDIVVANPPYQGTQKMKEASYFAAKYPDAKADLYAAFLERGPQLVREGGLSAMVTMRGWMFLTQFTKLREKLLQEQDLRLLGDVDRGAFESVPDEVVAATMSLFRRLPPTGVASIAMQPTPLSDRARDSERTARKRAAVLAQVGRFEFEVGRLGAVAGRPIVYWWEPSFLSLYDATPKLGEIAPTRFGITTGDNARYSRRHYELNKADFSWSTEGSASDVASSCSWAALVLGGKGAAWIEPAAYVIRWKTRGIEVKLASEFQYGTVSKQIRNEEFYFRRGLAISRVGSEFGVRVHRFPGVFADAGSSLFPSAIDSVAVLLNSRVGRFVVKSLSASGMVFQVGDVNKVPVIVDQMASDLMRRLHGAFSVHEAAREASIEFLRPGSSSWCYTQEWAQRAVDRPAGEPLPPFEPEYDPSRPVAFVSFGVGVALGRFGANGEGILDTAPASALPHGILFLSDATAQDSLGQEATRLLRDSWTEHGAFVGDGDDLRTWLRTGFFKHHKEVYENRAIYFPLSSERKSFVAWCSIHRWNETPGGTLQALLADHLMPEKRRLEGQLADVRQQRATATGKDKATADKRANELQKLRDELEAFIGQVTALLEQGPPPSDASTPPREVDARHAMDLDDGVMVNSAALWPLLEPQWKDPKKWWKQLATAQGKKDYDWSHLAARYFPTRVDAKAKDEPSMAVAHHVFWKYHPATAYRWELRLQDEIGPDFHIDEPGSDEAREAYLRDHPQEAEEIRHKENERRERKRRKEEPEQMELDEAGSEADEEEDDAA